MRTKTTKVDFIRAFTANSRWQAKYPSLTIHGNTANTTLPAKMKTRTVIGTRGSRINFTDSRLDIDVDDQCFLENGCRILVTADGYEISYEKLT